MKKINQLFPLVAEPHPETYAGYGFLTMISFNSENYITIVDNIVKEEIVAYVLDFCPKEFENKPEESEQAIIRVASIWYEIQPAAYPVSIEFARKGISAITSRIIRKFPIDFVTRVIGPLPEFNMGAPEKTKKRKKKSPPKGVEVIYRTLSPRPLDS